MTLTPLEAALIALLASIVSSLVVKFFVGQGKVNCIDCEKRHAALDTDLATTKKDDSEDHARIMRMLRSLITHSTMPPDKKEAILNDVGATK